MPPELGTVPWPGHRTASACWTGDWTHLSPRRRAWLIHWRQQNHEQVTLCFSGSGRGAGGAGWGAGLASRHPVQDSSGRPGGSEPSCRAGTFLGLFLPQSPSVSSFWKINPHSTKPMFWGVHLAPLGLETADLASHGSLISWPRGLRDVSPERLLSFTKWEGSVCRTDCLKQTT